MSWGKVLLNDEVFEDVLDEFGDKVIAKYGSYANIGKEMIEEILQWMWNRTFNKPNVGASGCSNEVVAEKKRKRGRPVGSGKKKTEGSPIPTTVTEKRKRGRPVGTGKKKEAGKKRKVKEEHTDLGMLMWYTSFMSHF